MAENPDDNDVAIDPVQRAVEERIRREALRQIETVDIEDDDSRIETIYPSVPEPVLEEAEPGRDPLPASGTEIDEDVTAEILVEEWGVDDTRTPYD